MGIDYFPVDSVADLKTLNDDEIVDGYMDGRDNFLCGDNRSRSYWHGWRNGRADSGHIKLDDAQRRLCHEVVKTGYLKELTACHSV